MIEIVEQEFFMGQVNGIWQEVLKDNTGEVSLQVLREQLYAQMMGWA